MTADFEQLNQLIELALDRSNKGRQTLAAQIGDLCSSESVDLTEQERDLISEILKKLLQDFELPIRRQLSERLAKSRNCPSDLVVMLANDQIEVARPVLMKSALLHDLDLVEIIRHRGRQHQIAIARRRGLSEVVSDALVETEDHDVIKVLLENEKAQISEATMAYLVEEARRVDSFQEPLVRRKDLNREVAKRLYWWVAAALRQEILSRYEIHAGELDNALEASVKHLTSAKDAESPVEEARSAAQELASRLAEQAPISADIIVKVLQRGEIPLFEALFGEASGVKPPHLQRMLYDSGGEGVAIACRALNFSKTSFATIFMLSRDRVMHARELSRATKVFDALNSESAEEILHRWKRDPGFQDALESLQAIGRQGKP